MIYLDRYPLPKSKSRKTCLPPPPMDTTLRANIIQEVTSQHSEHADDSHDEELERDLIRTMEKSTPKERKPTVQLKPQNARRRTPCIRKPVISYE
jgi:hypothetical protein